MLAFYSIIVDPSGNYKQFDGTIFSLPPELCDPHRVQQYLRIDRNGWSKSEFGYMALAMTDNLGNKYILPGLYLEDADKPSKKFYGHKANLNKKQVEDYLKIHLARLEETRKASESELTSLVHDLRHLSSSIYHSAFEAEEAAKLRSWQKTRELIRTIIASQTMLKVRIDYLDFSNSVDRFDDIEKIPVYSRVDKVIRCFRADARHKGIDISLAGPSYRQVEGPNILDIAPYTLIENAIKYSPENEKIKVEVKDTQDATVVSVTSMGPIFHEDEADQLFESGFRGRNATSIRSSGTGLGLSVANDVIKTFGGKLSVKQSEKTKIISGIPFAAITFSFRLPTSGEDKSKKHKHEKLQRIRGRRQRRNLA